MKDIVSLFEQMVNEIESERPVDESWGSGGIWKGEGTGSKYMIAKSITFYDFMDWLKKHSQEK